MHNIKMLIHYYVVLMHCTVRHASIFYSVVTVSYWLRSVGFGSVLS